MNSMAMKKIALLLVIAAPALAGFGPFAASFAQHPAPVEQQTQAPAQAKPCAIVQHEGGHAFRNVMLLGVAGTVISKERYKVIESNVAGLTPGEKTHGDELQARTQGAKVIVLRKNKNGLADAREACNKTAIMPETLDINQRGGGFAIISVHRRLNL